MIPGLLNHLWQSTLFIAAAALINLALRKNAARTRYAIWFAAAAKFLVPFALLINAGGLIEWRTQAAIVRPAIPAAMSRSASSNMRTARGTCSRPRRAG